MTNTIHTTDCNGHVNKLIDNTGTVAIEYWYRGNLIYDGVEYTKYELIEMARAVLAYYGEGVE